MTQILALNAFDGSLAAGEQGVLGKLLQQRSQLFGAASVLFYQHPLELVRAQGCWLYDSAGTAYLDAYNNVPSIGHCHPQVVEAAARQLGLLNIHNRYLHAATISYAQHLLAKLPSPLSNITFTCTGSEANDLALRLASSFTGGRGVIVTEAAYHGNTELVSQVSPSSHRDWQAPPHVRVVPAPLADPQKFAQHVTGAIDDLARQGIRFAALLADSIFSSDGVCADPAGFLTAAVDIVHRHDALFIADEVQPGFGRTGEGWWGFERHSVQPDIVTLGKPMGNGYPMGAVITRPEILRSYCADVGYFNTFGGSPVAAVVGQAVLDVIEREDLIGNASRVGAHLKMGLQKLAQDFPTILQVRGAGLYLGVQVGATRQCSTAASTAQHIINALRERRILIGAAGLQGDTLKLRPPLCFAQEHAEMLLSALKDVLTGLESA